MIFFSTHRQAIAWTQNAGASFLLDDPYSIPDNNKKGKEATPRNGLSVCVCLTHVPPLSLKAVFGFPQKNGNIFPSNASQPIVIAFRKRDPPDGGSTVKAIFIKQTRHRCTVVHLSGSIKSGSTLFQENVSELSFFFQAATVCIINTESLPLSPARCVCFVFLLSLFVWLHLMMGEG